MTEKEFNKLIRLVEKVAPFGSGMEKVKNLDKDHNNLVGHT
tara:strand:+ start:101 stop:223 length:123 start_codon:yes stop_codon:yes gene_type:complete